MVDLTLELTDNHPVPSYGRLIRKMVEPNRSWFPYLILLGEISVAIRLILGLFTPLALIVAILLNLNYISLAGVKPKDISVNRCYQCEQGQNWNMLIAEVVLLATAAGCTWSLDALLGIFCGA